MTIPAPLALSLADLIRQLRRRELSKTEVVAASLERAHRLQGALNCFTELRDDAPERAADAASGPLQGVPIAIKDMLVDEDRPPTCGSRAIASWMSGTAEVVRRVRAAGATVVGYTNLHEWGVGTTSAITATGPVHNPWALDRVPGGSSGGSAAAVAAGIVPIAIGTDAGASIRVPAAWCGIVGLKPTFDRVPTEGFVNHGVMIDHVGPLARSVDDVATLFEVLVGEELSLPDPSTLRVGVARRHFFADLDPEVADVVDAAIQTLEGVVANVTEVDVAGAETANFAIALALLPVVARVLGLDFAQAEGALQEETQRLVSLGAGMGEEELQQAEAARLALVASWERAFVEVDVIVTPTVPAPPPSIADQTVSLPSGTHLADVPNIALNGPMNLGGVPSLSLPCGELSGGLTTSLTLTAARGNDELVLAVSGALERALDHRFANRIAPL